jgi:RNA polymerase sigma-70 factor (ECF subfamily)
MNAAPTLSEPRLTDQSLLRRLRGGNKDAATVLYVRYAQRLRALVKARCSPALSRHVEPDDIVQSIFHRFFRRVCQGHYDVPEGEELWGLFLVMALNRIRSEETYHRAAKRNVHATQAIPADLPTSAVAPDESSYAALHGTLTEVMDQLAAPQRQMVELRIQGHSVADIARTLGRSKRTVERNLQEVRRQLRQALDPATTVAGPLRA